MALAKVVPIRKESTLEEDLFLINSAEKLINGLDVGCPRCGNDLIYKKTGTSCSIYCSDDTCIEAGLRGI